MSSGTYILLVEDNPGDAGLVRHTLDDARPALPPLRWVRTLADGVAILGAEPGCGGILLDLGLPDAQGLTALETIRGHAPRLPVVVLSGLDDDDVGMAAVVAGAQDYLVKGRFDSGELRRAFKYAQHRQRIEVGLVERALHDALTGLPTRALLLDRIEMAIRRAARDDRRGAILFIDLDGFKQVNDRHGHAAGDAVLKTVATRLVATVRACDTVARLGGDEFVVLLPEMANDLDGDQVAHKIITALEQPLPWSGASLQVPASIGVAEFCGTTPNADDVMRRADEAMYDAKREGKATVRRFRA